MGVSEGPWCEKNPLSRTQIVPDEALRPMESALSRAAVDGGKLPLSYGRLLQVQLAKGSESDLSNFNSEDADSEFHLGMVGDSVTSASIQALIARSRVAI